MRGIYTGHEALTFSDYIDLETGKTLHAQPGGVYDLAPASGRVVPAFPEPWFTPADGPVEVAAVWAAEPDHVPEPEPDPQSDDEQPEA